MLPRDALGTSGTPPGSIPGLQMCTTETLELWARLLKALRLGLSEFLEIY